MNQPLDAAQAVRLRQRLWGAAVLIAILVIVLPLLLDGSGSESRFRRVENLRQEPPVIIDLNTVGQPQVRLDDAVSAPQPDIAPEIAPDTTADITADITPDITVEKAPDQTPGSVPDSILGPDTDPASVNRVESTTDERPTDAPSRQAARPEPLAANVPAPIPPESQALADDQPYGTTLDQPLTAWVVQVGSFADKANAMAMRDSLRSAGFPTFTSLTGDGSSHRVRVGPFADRQWADQRAGRITDLLGREVVVLRYP